MLVTMVGDNDTERHNVKEAVGLSEGVELRHGDDERLGEPECESETEGERDPEVEALWVTRGLYDWPGVMIVGLRVLELQADTKGL